MTMIFRDTGFNQCLNYGYDEFNRLASRSSVGNTEFTYVYDRYGNRWQQNALQGGPSPQLAFNKATNQVSGYAYDAAGNVLNDGLNSYQYDAEGNLIQANTGSATLRYTYNALNQQVRFDYNSSTFTTYVENIFDAQGKFSANWNSGNFIGGIAYWGSTAIESYFPSPVTAHFLLRDALGSMRFETNNTGAVTVNRYTLSFGDGTTNVSGSRNTNDGFAGMPDSPSGNHAQFRDYSNVAGRWLQPDPYDGSYDAGNPQSLNRYSYVLNNPLRYVDPSGQECVWDDGSFDSADDPETGSLDGCGSAGGTYVDPGAFSTLGAGDWSNQPDSGIAAVASTLKNSSITINVNADGSESIVMQGMNLDGMVQTPVTSSGTLTPPIQGIDPSQLPNCYTVEANVIAGDLNPFSPGWSTVTSLAGDAATAGSTYKATQAAIYAGTRINTKGGIGLIQPLKSSTYRGVMAESSLLGKVSGVLFWGSIDVSLIRSMYAAVTTPCR